MALYFVNEVEPATRNVRLQALESGSVKGITLDSKALAQLEAVIEEAEQSDEPLIMELNSFEKGIF